MGLEEHTRIIEDAETRILEEAVQTSYEKGGKVESVYREEVSRETVKNKLHEVRFLKVENYSEEKETEEELIKLICYGTKKEFEEKTEALKKGINHPNSKKRIEKGKVYVLNNWTAARLRLLRKNGVKGSSTESHVSHILSDRMSSRLMEWSKEGM